MSQQAVKSDSLFLQRGDTLECIPFAPCHTAAEAGWCAYCNRLEAVCAKRLPITCNKRHIAAEFTKKKGDRAVCNINCNFVSSCLAYCSHLLSSSSTAISFIDLPAPPLPPVINDSPSSQPSPPALSTTGGGTKSSESLFGWENP